MSTESAQHAGKSLDAILARVPELACEPVFDDCLIEPERLRPPSTGAPSQVAGAAEPEWIERVRKRLSDRRAEAELGQDVELGFLCGSLLHFLSRIPAEEHPFVIALYLRSLARRDGIETDPERVGAAMDHYSAMLARDAQHRGVSARAER